MKTLIFCGASLILALSTATFAQNPISEEPVQTTAPVVEPTDPSAALLAGFEPASSSHPWKGQPVHAIV